MRNQDTISAGQLGWLFFSYMTGSSIIFIPGPVIGFAGNGAWLSLSASCAAGLLILGGILYVHRSQGQQSFVAYSIQKTGRTLAAVLLAPFALYLFMMVAWIVLGVGDFMTSSMMRDTPLYIFNILILATSAMTVRAGMEVMARMFILYMFIILFFVAAVLLLSIPNYHPEFLLPIMPDGIRPLLHGSYYTFGFPYAEVAVFLLLLSYVRTGARSRLAPPMLLALVLNGLLLSVSTVASLMVYGPIAGEVKYSLFGMSRLIDYEEFLQRIESVIGISLITGSYMKATIALFALRVLLTELTGAKDERLTVFPAALICFLLSVTMFKNEAEFIEKFTTVWPLVNAVFGLLPLLILSLAAGFRSRMS